MKLSKAVRAYFKAQGKRGGETRAAKLSPERRKEIAAKARAAQLRVPA